MDLKDYNKRGKKMIKNKMKKIFAIVLAMVMILNGMYVQEKEVKAATTEISKYDNFADAVENLYKGGTDQIVGDYGLAYFSDDYEYSVVKKTYSEKYDINETVNNKQAGRACLWEATDILTDVSSYYVNKIYGAQSTQSIKYLKSITGTELQNVEGINDNSSCIKWDYDIVEVVMGSSKSFNHAIEIKTYAVNVRPSGKVSGCVTLPAYVNVDGKGTVPCVEVGDGAFLKNDKITEVNIPDTYQRICAYAFTGCVNMKSVKFVTTKKLDTSTGYIIDTSTTEQENIDNSSIHMMGAGVFAGCKALENVLLPTVLTEGYGYKSGDTFKFGTFNVYETYKMLVTNREDTEASELIKEGKAIKYGDYFLGEGIYRDCYSIKSVTIDGYNPYIPAATFAGCSGISRIELSDTVKNVYLGVASFAGADGNNPASEKSSLKSLIFDTEALETVTIGAYAFKNNFLLENVEIKADLNPVEIYTKVQNTRLGQEFAFENSFNKGSFVYEPKKISSFTIPEGFFKNCDLSNISIMENKYTDKQPGSKQSYSNVLGISKYAFEGIKCDNITLMAQQIVPHTSAFYGMDKVDILKFEGFVLDFKGEPFANTMRTALDAYSLVPPLKKIVISSSIVSFLDEKIVESYWYDKELNSFSTKSTFYGVSSSTNLIFTDKVSTINNITPCEGVKVYEQKDTSPTLDIEKFRQVDRNALGEISRIYIQGYKTKVWSFDEQCSNNRTIIYADGSALQDLKERSEKFSCYTIQNYSSEILDASTYWVETETEFKSERVNNGKGVQVLLADGNYNTVEYAGKEQSSGMGESGYVVKNMQDVKNAVAKGIGLVNMSIEYRGLVKTIKVNIVHKEAIQFKASAKNISIVEGAEPSADCFDITDIKYNDDSTEASLTNLKNVSVKLIDGFVYKNGSNEVEIFYMGHKENVVVNAEPEKVVSMSAIQVNNKVYVGDKLTNKDFDVTAYYNSGKVKKNYVDFEIVEPDVTEERKVVTIKNSMGVEANIDLKVTPVNPKSLSVAYNGIPVQEGALVDKKNFAVTVIYDNNTKRILGTDEFDIEYSLIIGNCANSVKVIYKANRAITETVYVTGIAGSEEGRKPPVTIEPDLAATPKKNETVTLTPDNNTDASTLTAGTETTSPTVTPNENIIKNKKMPDTVVTLKNMKSKVTLGVGEKIRFIVKDATGITYRTNDSKIVTISSEGIVTAKKVGKTQIIATDKNGNIKTCIVTIKKAPKKIKLNFNKKTLKKGKKVKIKVSFAKGYYSKTIIFKSSNKKVVTVNKKGVIVAKKKGNCKITIKTYNGKKKVIKIIVK